jgi:hypothetical protein
MALVEMLSGFKCECGSRVIGLFDPEMMHEGQPLTFPEHALCLKCDKETLLELRFSGYGKPILWN